MLFVTMDRYEHPFKSDDHKAVMDIFARDVEGIRPEAPDGYTLTYGPNSLITLSSFTAKGVQFNVDSFDYVCGIHDTVYAIAVRNDSPIKTFKYLEVAATTGKT